VVGRPTTAAGRFEGVVNGEPVCGTVAVVATSCPRAFQQHRDVVTVLDVARQWRGWPHKVDSDGEDRSRRPDVTVWPRVVTEKVFDGAAGPPLRARRVIRTGVGGIVSRSVEPLSEADPARGSVEPSSEADLARGGVKASSEADLARGSVEASNEADSACGSV
jgi:hypothetical protein